MKEIGDAFKIVLERIAAFFDIFDLSFLVSGAVGFAALVIWLDAAGARMPITDGWLKIFALIIACYVIGLLCFATGRWLRMQLLMRIPNEAFDKAFLEILQAHGLAAEAVFVSYIGRRDIRGVWRLYVRLWAELRDSERSGLSLAFLNRYWVMAATYDGLGASMILWGAVVADCMFGLGAQRTISPNIGVPALVILAVCSLACFREASRYLRYQIEELVASIAAVRARR
jgi:hypothetical protein